MMVPVIKPHKLVDLVVVDLEMELVPLELLDKELVVETVVVLVEVPTQVAVAVAAKVVAVIVQVLTLVEMEDLVLIGSH